MYTCTLDSGYNAAMYTTWQQFYDRDSSVAPALEIKSQTIKYQIYLENFDNDTFFRVMPYHLHSDRIIFNSYVKTKEENISKLTFTDTENVVFDCGKYLNYSKYVYVGLINTKEQKIETMDTTKLMKQLGKENHGNMLCCLYYTIYVKGSEKQIVRYVRNKTLLQYKHKPTVPSDVRRRTNSGIVRSDNCPPGIECIKEPENSQSSDLDKVLDVIFGPYSPKIKKGIQKADKIKDNKLNVGTRSKASGGTQTDGTLTNGM
uniref:Uncharacterized protein n=1 Tax=Heliothis virescens TaxID=7102 RepID=A0A2A4J4D5_HELVI